MLLFPPLLCRASYRHEVANCIVSGEGCRKQRKLAYLLLLSDIFILYFVVFFSFRFCFLFWFVFAFFFLFFFRWMFLFSVVVLFCCCFNLHYVPFCALDSSNAQTPDVYFVSVWCGSYFLFVREQYKHRNKEEGGKRKA